MGGQEKILEKRAGADDSVTVYSLTLTHRALHDVPSLTTFSHLEKLDLTFNAITSLSGLGSCANLKWLSVSQNKLRNLKGIEGLSKLFVLNASKNKLKTIDEVKPLISLRALILNDNDITYICGLDQMKDLNTLVLSRNPISEIGESLAEAKGMTKLSLSNCRLSSIGSSLRRCTRLRELRLSHNELEGLPRELMYNRKLHILDLGNNLVVSMSHIKTALVSSPTLRNLNLVGNPVMEKPNIEQQVRKLVQSLRIFNGKGTKRTELRSKDAGTGPMEGGTAEVGSARKRRTEPGPAGEKKEAGSMEPGSLPKRAKRSGPGRVSGPIVDDPETPFLELFEGGEGEEGDRLPPPPGGGDSRRGSRVSGEKGPGECFRFDMVPAIEVGLGGSSTWE